MSETFTLYKLIVLYMLSKVDFPLTNAQISEFILDKGYTTFFKLQQALSELIDTDLIREETIHNRTLYHLTEDGEESIYFFKNKISKPIQDDIDQFLREKKYDLKNETAVKADYYKNTAGEFSVRCQVMEQQEPLIDLTLSVPTEAEAEKIATNWQKKNQTVYAWLMAQLLE